MNQRLPRLGLGIGWRPELALPIDRRHDLGFVELLAEDFDPARPVADAILNLLGRGVRAVPHGVSLSLGGADPVAPARVRRLAKLAARFDAPFVSEHIAFVRAGGVEAGHLLPVPRTRAALDVLVENVRATRDQLPVPLALENISALFEWPDAELAEADFLTEALERTDSLLLLDIANVWANARNLPGADGGDPVRFLERIPLDRLAYVHVAGGVERAGVYHDTHTAAVPAGVLELLEELCARVDPPGVMLERDGDFPDVTALNAELDAVAAAVARGAPPDGRCGAGAFSAGAFGGHDVWGIRVSEDARRARLAAEQALLVGALAGRAGVPEGFDPARVELAALTLLNKRRKGVAYTWPSLVRVLGDAYPGHFRGFAAEVPPHAGGPHADGLAFARWLDRRRQLPDAVVPELLRARLRSGRPVGVALRRVGRRIWIGVRLPLVGVWLTSIPWARR